MIGKHDGLILVKDVEILHNMIGSDHLPMIAEIEVMNGNSNHELNQSKSCLTAKSKTYIDWRNLKQNDIGDINNRIRCDLQYFLGSDVMNCCILGCRDVQHVQMLDNFYSKLVASVEVSSSKYCKEIKRKCKFKVIPGWNRNVKDKYKLAREDFISWLRMGRSRDGPVYTKMQESRRIFKQALNECKQNEQQERSLSVQVRFMNKKMKEF